MIPRHARIDFFIDKETRSRLDLSKVGPIKYAAHPSTEATLVTYCVGRLGEVKAWLPQFQQVPHEIADLLVNPHKYNFIAWNVTFDYLIWICKIGPRYAPINFKRPDLEGITDAMALSCHFRTGASLETACKIVGLKMSKDPEGRRIMLKQCKPGKNGEFAQLTREEWDRFIYYGKMDTYLLREVYYRLPPLPEPERYAWEWTFRRNIEGIRIDMELVKELSAIVDASLPFLEAEFMKITGLKLNSHEKVRDWFKQFYPWIQNMRAETIRDLLIDQTPVPLFVRRALELKDLGGSSAIAKLKTAVDIQYCGRIFELLAYHHAGTKRWAGRGIQVQNFPRVNKKRPDSIKFEMNVEDLAAVLRALRPGLKDPVGFVKNLLRRIWLPEVGEQFYCGDFAKVEPSVLFWLCDMGSIPKLWYEEMAAEIFNKRIDEIEDGSEERTIGKIANLSCQYQTGGDGYRKSLYKDTGIALSKEQGDNVVKAYRRKNRRIVEFWGELETAFRLAIYGQASSLCRGRVHFLPMEQVFPGFKGVAIRLPSGSYLFYHHAEEVTSVRYEKRGQDNKSEEISEYEWKELSFYEQGQYTRKVKKSMRYLADGGDGKVMWKYVYGGLLCENVVSGTARDIIVPATWQLENAGFKILSLVHDEIWGSAVAGRENEFKHLMCINPSWCDMEIGSDLKVGVRYLK